MGLEDFEQHPAYPLSGGMQQRLGIARVRVSTSPSERCKLSGEASTNAPITGSMPVCGSKGFGGVDPANGWNIADSRPYLHYRREIQKKSGKDIPGFIEKADRNRPGVLD